MDLRTKFLKIYPNIPLALRDEIVVVIKEEPLSWHAAWLEVEQDTTLGREILKILSALKII